MLSMKGTKGYIMNDFPSSLTVGHEAYESHVSFAQLMQKSTIGTTVEHTDAPCFVLEFQGRREPHVHCVEEPAQCAPKKSNLN